MPVMIFVSFNKYVLVEVVQKCPGEKRRLFVIGVLSVPTQKEADPLRPWFSCPGHV